MIRKFSFLVCVVFLAGCAKLAHLEQLLTLKAVSDNRDMQAEYVAQQNKKFERMLAAVKSGDFDQYPDQKSIVAEFGDPVFTRSEMRGSEQLELWLYRYATEYFDSEKVYLYFDKAGILQDWEYVVPRT